MGFKLKEYRKKLGISQQELSEKAGVSRTIISGLESGRIKVTSTGTLLKIAVALNAEIGDIFYVKGA